MSAAHSGATALVPPITCACPSTRTSYPVSGSALPATSGTPRPLCPLGAFGTPAACCHAGSANSTLTPPPVAPSPLAVSFHTTSAVMAGPGEPSRGPPPASGWGLDEGKPTGGVLPLSPSLEPLSPQATVTV